MADYTAKVNLITKVLDLIKSDGRYETIAPPFDVSPA